MEKKIDLLPDEEIHTLIEDRLYILQKKEYFRFGIDAVLLANWVKVKGSDKVLDLGTGTGIIPLLIAFKKKPHKVTGVEIQTEMTEMAKRSVMLNGLHDKIEIINYDLRKIKELFQPNTFSLVVSNPPYFPVNRGELNVNDAKAVARHEIFCTLLDLVQSAAYLLGTGGRFALIHRVERLPEIINTLLKYRFEPKILRLIQPKVGKSPNLVLIEAIMDGKPGLKVEPNLVVYDERGFYTPEVLEFYNGTGVSAGVRKRGG